MKKFLFLTFIIPLLTLQCCDVYSQVKLEINYVSGYSHIVEVSGYVPKTYSAVELDYKNNEVTRTKEEGLFLGVTAIVGGEEIDFAWKVKPVNGRFKETYEASAPGIIFSGSGVEWVAALWQGKMTKSYCTYRFNSPCKYCRKNGFHLDERIIRKVL
jgi:hypothetical protein